MSDTLDRMQTVELGVARNLVTRGSGPAAQRGTVRAAHRNPAGGGPDPWCSSRHSPSPGPAAAQAAGGALDSAAVQLPERVRQFGDSGSCYEPRHGADRRAVRGCSCRCRTPVPERSGRASERDATAPGTDQRQLDLKAVELRCPVCLIAVISAGSQPSVPPACRWPATLTPAEGRRMRRCRWPALGRRTHRCH
jgi:hypothetical protein